MMTMRIHFYRTLTAAALPFALGTILLCAPAERCDQLRPSLALLRQLPRSHEPAASGPGRDGGSTSKSAAPSVPAAAPDPEISPAVAKQLAAMQAEIEELKALLKSNAESAPASARAMAPAAIVAPTRTREHDREPGCPGGAGCRYDHQAGKARADGSLCLCRLDVAERQPAQQGRGLGFEVLHSRDPIDIHYISRTSTIRKTTPWAGRPKSSARTKSRWSRSALAATSTGKT